MNLWKIATIALIILDIILIGMIIYRDKIDICDKITSTPSWLNKSLDIINVGYVPIISQSMNDTTAYYKELNNLLEEKLINEQITFVYKEGCAWCQKQINEFKEINFWDSYVNSGLTRSC